MGKYIFELLDTEKFNAGTKAKKDISKILNNNRYINVNLDPDMNKLEKLIFAPSIIKRKLSRIENGSEFVFQYPLYSKLFSKIFLNQLFKKKNFKKIVIIHDIESLRLNKDKKGSVKKELNILNKFDKIVSHNSSMSDWLVDNGIPANKINNIEIFDYLNEQDVLDAKFENNIVFAGNLRKSSFLKKVPANIPLDLFGLNPPTDLPKNLRYMGVFSPDELPKYLNGSFGLVWDGSSVEKCDGIMGEYLKYNNPHKTSLYLSCGLPVIVWDNSAISKFIEKNKVGFSVGSLYDISNILSNLTEDEYETMRENAVSLSKKLRSGYFTKKSLNIDND